MFIRQRYIPETALDREESIISCFSSDISSSSSISEHTLLQKPIGLVFWFSLFSILFITSIYVIHLNDDCRTGCHFGSKCGLFNLSINESLARTHLKTVTGYGVRMAGSYSNEILARRYLLAQLQLISDIALSNGLEAYIEDHLSSFSSFRAHTHIMSYGLVRNIAILMHNPKNGPVDYSPAILVNCHYDSAIGSRGATDAFVNCANMLESARIFALNDVPLNIDVIFLFNGAEESLLPASHAFITQHKWAKRIVLFINLEGAGVGGRMFVFQTGPGLATKTLVSAYSSNIRQPFGNVFGEEIFHLGVIPSDTDFRIFRDYGLISGIDMAYINDGYVYHTEYDVEERIKTECLQQAGDNLVNFLSSLVSDLKTQAVPRLKPLNNPEQALNYDEASEEGGMISFQELPVVVPPYDRVVYFDVLGYYFFMCPFWIWRCLDAFFVVIFFAWILYIRRKNETNFYGVCFAVFLHLIWLLSGFLFLCSLGLLIHKYGSRMSWYSIRYNIFGIFFLPLFWFLTTFYTFIVSVPTSPLFELSIFKKSLNAALWVSAHNDVNSNRIEQDHFIAGVGIILSIMSLLDLANSPASYLFTITAMLPWLSRVALSSLLRPKDPSLTILLASTLPYIVLVQAYLGSSLFDVLIPITGRIGQTVKPDVVIAALCFMILSPVGLFLGGYLQVTSHQASKWLRLLLLNASVAYALMVHTSPLGFPYTTYVVDPTDVSQSAPRYQRIALIHVNRGFRDVPDSFHITSSDSGIFVVPLDANGARYLTPGSFPSPISHSIFSIFKSPSKMSYSGLQGLGLSELVGAKRYLCLRSRPFCGIPFIFPFAQAFFDFFWLTRPVHTAQPPVNLVLLDRFRLHPHHLPMTLRSDYSTPGLRRQAYNICMAITSGPPHTHIFIRTEVPRVRLLDWSFAREAGKPRPLSLPPRASTWAAEEAEDMEYAASDSEFGGAHFYIYNVNPSAPYTHDYLDSVMPSSDGPLNPRATWEKPLHFWLVLDLLVPDEGDSIKNNSFDISLTGAYFDNDLPSSQSEELTTLLNHLPPWTNALSFVSTYQVWRILLP
ncbi:unnamed protein product [Protopolystoma xenopodis]|uniref:Uncharacterized protein n=1 Tax=Protopolystoma xenopodis TaxID=117903 RepID=A0A3S5A7N6_9PLAT|nr:unnamed protein product [Protopolystoma xenopodis]